jgi:undecaprenyl-diphosphatase
LLDSENSKIPKIFFTFQLTPMTLLQALILGLLQGITEFLPISSSGHLVLAESFFGLEVKELLIFDVVLHAGTLVALVVYFWKDLVQMTQNLWKDLKGMLKKKDDEQRLRDPDNPREQVWFLILATIPIVLIGPFLKDVIEQVFRDEQMVIFMLAVTALLLATAEVLGKRTEGKLHSMKVALVMGLFQVMAVIPGISRSGSTMVGGLLGGLKREAAARFAFLMAVPAIGGATVFLLKDMFDPEMAAQAVATMPLLVGFTASVIASFICMYGMLKFLRKRSLWWFVAYLVIVNGVWMFA